MSERTRVGFTLTLREFQELEDRIKATACQNRAEYLRKMVFGRPVRARVHNASLDNMIEELVCLRRELATLALNPALSPAEKLHLRQIHQQIQQKIDQIADHVCKSKL